MKNLKEYSKEEQAHLKNYIANPTSAVPLEKPTPVATLPHEPSVPELLKVDWKMSQPSDSVTTKIAAVIDTGIGNRKKLPAELEGKVLLWYNYEGKSNLTDPKADLYDSYGHGTHMAGLIVADQVPGSPVGGMAPMCKLISIKVTDGDDCVTPICHITQALKLVLTHNENPKLPRIDVVNLSFNVYDNCLSSEAVNEHALYNTLEELKNTHVPVVVSGGNFYKEKDGLGYPAYCEQVIAAGACNIDNTGRGHILRITQRMQMPHVFSTKLPFFILTHGVNTYSTGINGYSYLTCSSQAAAVTTGAILLYLMKQWDQIPSVTDIKKKLFHSTQRLYLDVYDQEVPNPSPETRQFAMAHDISVII